MSPRFVTSGGVDLAVFEEGNPAGPTVLLVHGYPDTHEVWDEVCAELEADYRLVRYDVRGAGRSGQPTGLTGYRLDQLADDLFAVINAVGGPVHLVAHDWGSIQAWHAATDPRATATVASFTSMSGPCLDHVGYWFRRRMRRPTPRHVAQLTRQLAMSWYIVAFQVPLLTPAFWRFYLARRWPQMLRTVEGVPPRAGLPAPTLRDDAVRGISLYRANMRRRVSVPAPRSTLVPVQLIELTDDHYVSPALLEDVERWAPNLTRRRLKATHWSAMTASAPALADWIRGFAASATATSTATATRTANEANEATAATSTAGRTSIRTGSPTRDQPFAGQLAVITGAGSGIGRATAFALAERGAHVIATDIDLAAARRTAELAGLMGRCAHAYRLDVTDSEMFTDFAGRLMEEHGVPGILVNNAGIAHFGTVLGTTGDEWRRVLEVNLWGVLHGCRAFGARMAERGAPAHIVNVASAAAYLPSKQLAAYSTSKAAVAMMSDCLRAELADSGVGVSVVFPGFINTNITRTTTFSGLTPEQQQVSRERGARLYARRNYPAEKVAEAIVDAVRHRRASVAVTPEAKAGRLISRLTPAAVRAIARLDLG